MIALACLPTTPEAATGLPADFHEWMPLAQAITLGLLTFVQEDLPTVGGALLAVTGRIHWMAGFAGCLLGIWVGDALLYLLARGFGRPLLDRPWFARRFDSAAVMRSELWFARNGAWILFASRFVPGTRLPTYLAAGFLRVPFPRFLLVTGSAVALWVSAIFALAELSGPLLRSWLERWEMAGWVVAGMLVLSAGWALPLIRREGRRRCAAAVGRWMRWEFWPAWLFYGPVALNYLWLAIRYRGLTLPSAANPGIFSGGLVGESKIATLRPLQERCPEFTAEAGIVEGDTLEERITSLEGRFVQMGMAYPFILKPDAGQRGAGVRLVRTAEAATTYLKQMRAAALVQSYAPGPNEAGIFYYRWPHEARGRIFAITEKVFPAVTGDGRSTIAELIWKDGRARFIADKYLARLGKRCGETPGVGESVALGQIGNHAQGCIFRDGWHLYSPELEQRIDEISRRVDGFYIGRYDVRYSSREALRAGEGFQIIELNGAAAEATNIYDVRNSLFSAYRILFRQWKLVFAIGAANRSGGTRPMSVVSLWRAWRENRALTRTYPPAG